MYGERLDKLEAADTYGLGALLRLPVYGGIKLGGWYGWSFRWQRSQLWDRARLHVLADLAGPRSEQCAEQAPGAGCQCSTAQCTATRPQPIPTSTHI